MTAPEVIGTIDITPSDETLSMYTMMFIDNILGDVPKRRKAPTTNLMVTIIEQTLWLYSRGRFDLIANILNHLSYDPISPRYLGVRRTETEAGSLSRT